MEVFVWVSKFQSIKVLPKPLNIYIWQNMLSLFHNLSRLFSSGVQRIVPGSQVFDSQISDHEKI